MKHYKHILTFFIFFTGLLLINRSYAQVLPQNLTNVKIDNLSDSQISQLIQQAHTAGINDNQIGQYAQSQGLPSSEAGKLQIRVNSILNKKQNSDANITDQPTTRNVVSQPDTVLIKQKPGSGQPYIFGSELFSGSNNTFEPNLRLATPVNYILGPDDQLNINVYGRSVVNWKLTVSPEGNINLPSGGILKVAGQTIEQASQAIKARLISKNYAIGSGTDVKISLGDIRSIKVIMIGEVVKPGTYTLPSLATAFNALYAAGGPNNNGSYRQIEIIRSNKIIRRLDVYDFLLKGDQKDNIALQDQDIIRIPDYQTRVEMTGEVKNPAIFEVLPTETLQDIIRFAGGFDVQAYTARIRVSQIVDQKRRITEIPKTDYSAYKPQPGDKFTVDKILDRYENRVTINGAVFRPGEYELQKGLTLSQLISNASGLREDAFRGRGTITRLNADYTTELISFNLADVLNKAVDYTLQKEDVVVIFSIFELRDQYRVKISGEVRRPGDYAYADSMKIANLVLLAGGFSEGASTIRIEVARRISDSDPASKTSATAKVFSADVDPTLKPELSDFTLKPFDIVVIYSLPGYEKQKIVHIEGEVVYPGAYAIQQKNEKISDIVKRAGGLTAAADADGSTLKRTHVGLLSLDGSKVDTTALLNERNQRLSQLKQSFRDSLTNRDVQAQNNYVGIDMREVIDRPGSVTDLIMKDGDIITVPQQLQTVQINGEVHLPSGVVFRSGTGFNEYISRSGGYSTDALRRGAYVVYPNGAVQSTHKFLFFNVHPTVKPGSEIYVPKKPARRPFAIGEIVGLISAVATTAILAIVSLRH